MAAANRQRVIEFERRWFEGLLQADIQTK